MGYRAVVASADTEAGAHRAQLAAYAGMGAAARLEIGIALSEDTRRVTAAGIRSRHPDYDDESVQLALRRLVLGEALFRAAWPGARLVEP